MESRKIKEEKIVGELFDEKIYKIIRIKENMKLKFVLEDENGIQEEYDKEQRICDLMHPWDKIHYYKDEKGVHWFCVVYDGLSVDVWSDGIEGLRNIVAEMYG